MFLVANHGCEYGLCFIQGDQPLTMTKAYHTELACHRISTFLFRGDLELSALHINPKASCNLDCSMLYFTLAGGMVSMVKVEKVLISLL